jgi:hypothetical protein
MTKRLVLPLTLLVALVATAQASAGSSAWRGVVVAKDAKQGTVVTATATGAARTVRTPKARSLVLGQRLDVRGTALGDGTYKAVAVKSAGRAKKARLKAVVVRNQKAQRRLLVSAGGSTFALSRRGAGRALASVAGSGPKPGDRIDATVALTPATAEATSLSTTGHLGVLEVEGILTKLATDSIELVVAKKGFVTLALPAGFAMPAGIAVFDEVEVQVAVGTDGKLTVLSIHGEEADDDHGVDFDDDDGELEVKGTIAAISETSISVTTGKSSTAVTCALRTPLTGFAVGDTVELHCRGSAGALVLDEIEHEDDDDDDDDEDEDEDDDDEDDDDEDDDEHDEDDD